MKKFKINKLWKVSLALLISLTSIGTLINSVDLLANEEFDVIETVTLNEEKTKAKITLDTSNIDEKYTVQSIQNPDGTNMDFENDATYTVDINGKYTFIVKYTDSTSEDQEELVYNKEVNVTQLGIEEAKEETQTNEKAETKQPRTVTRPSGDSLTVEFEKDNTANIDWTDITQVDWNFYDSEKIVITAVFAGKGTDKTREIEVDIPDGYQIIGYSAKTGTDSQNGESILTTTEEVQQSMTSSTLTSQNGGAFGSEGIEGYKTTSNVDYTEANKSGKIKYVFNSEADIVTLTLQVGIDKKFYDYSDTKQEFSDVLGLTNVGTSTGQLLNDMKITQTSGSEVLEESAKANIKTTLSAMYLHSGDRQSTTYIDSDNYSPNIKAYGGTLYYANSINSFELLVDELVMTYNYPEGSEFIGMEKETSFTKAANMTYNNNTATRTLTVRYTNFYTTGTISTVAKPLFKLDGDVYGTDGIKQASANFKSTMATKVYGNDNYYIANNSFTVNILDENIPLEIVGYDQTVYDYTLNGYEDGYQFLGNFDVSNKSFVDKENLDLQWTFDSSLGIRIARMAIPNNSTISNLKIYTTNNPTGFDVGDMKSTNTSHGTGTIIDADKLGLADGEYITKIEGTIDKYPAQTDTRTAWATTIIGYCAYGNIQNGSGGSHKLTIDGISSTSTITTTTTRLIDIDIVTTNTLENSYYPGDTIPVETKFSTYTNSYNRSKKVTDNFLQDPNIYIRVPKGFELDETSMNVTFGSTNVTDKATLVSKAIDVNDGATIYKYSFNEEFTIMAGRQMKSNSVVHYNATTNFGVDFDLKVSVNNQGAAAIQLKDIIMIEGKGNFIGYDGRESYIRTDDFNLTSSGYNLMVPNTTQKITVIKKPELQVSSGIRVKDSGNDFSTYDGSDSSIAGLSRSKNAEIEISYFNNAPNAFSDAAIYFPIPKEGEDYGTYFNNKALTDPLNTPDSTPFTWSADLTDDIVVPGFTTYYATGGSVNATSNDGSLTWEAFIPDIDGWQSYSEVSANLKDVVFIKFEANTPIVSGASDSFSFELKVAADSPVDVVSYWRTYSTAVASGATTQAGVVGSVLAASPSIGEISGLVFYDNNANGKYDAGDAIYTGSNLTVNLTEKDGKISTTTLTVNADGTYSIEQLKEGEYTISAINSDNGNYHFSKTTASTGSIIGSNVTANTNHTEGKYEGMVIKAADKEAYENVGIGLISKIDTSYEFENRVMNDTSLDGKAKIVISGNQIEYNGTLVNNTFPQENFAITPNVALPEGMVHVGWQLYSVDSSNAATKLGDVILPSAFKDTAVPTVASGSSLLVKAVVSYGPTITTSDLTKYVGDNVNLLDGVTATTESSATITLVTGLLGNTEVTQSIPSKDNKYTTAGTYEVAYKVKDLATGSYTTVKRLVKVHEAPTVNATPQEYTLGDASIMTNVLNNPSATWKEAQATVGDPTIQTINGPAITTDAVNTIKAEISGPSSDFSVTGIHTVTYTATDANGKKGSKTVDVFIKSDTYTVDPTGTIGIDVDYFVLENADAKNLTATTAKTDANGNPTAFTKTFDESNVQIGYAEIDRGDISVNATQLEAIKKVGAKGGIYDLTYSVTKDNKTAEITVKVLVKPVNYEESDDESLVITANGFAIDYEDASTFDDTQATTLGLPVAYKITKDAQGKITNIETVTSISVNASHISDIQGAPKTGETYNLEYSVSDVSEVSSITVEVLVRPKGSISDEDLSITAFNFILENSEASLLDQDDANTRGNSIAHKTVYTDGEISSYANISDKITVNTDDLTKINNAGAKGGIFDLTYTIKDGNNTKTKTIEVFVKPYDGGESPDGKLIVSANGFAIEYIDAANFGDAEATALGLPVAYKITTDIDGDIIAIDEYSPIEVNTTHISDIQNAPVIGGTYDLEFFVSDGSEVAATTVEVFVRPKGSISDEDLSIAAFGFILENEDAASLDQDDANAKGNSIAYRTEHTNGEISGYTNISDKITVDEKELEAIKTAGNAGGIFDLTYTIKDGNNTKTKTIQVLVKPLDSVSDSSESVVIYAKGFGLTHEEATALTDAEANSRACSVAYGITYDEDGIITDIKDITSDITVDSTQLSDIQKPSVTGGIFDLTFSVTNGTNSVSIEVPVLVEPKYKETDETGTVVLGAHGFTLKNDEASSLDEELAVQANYGNVSAYKYVYDANGNLIGYTDITSKITVNAEELKTINGAPVEGGIYDLTFYVAETVRKDGKDVEVTIEKTVKVVVEGTTTPPIIELPDGDNLAITAKDFTVENADAAGVDKSTAIALSEAQAWLLKKGTQVDVSVDEAMLKEIQNAPAKGGVYDLTFFATYTPLTRAEEAYTIETTIKVTVLPLDEKKPSTAPTTPTTSNPSVAGNGTNTGDTTNLNLYIGLAVISLLVIAGRKFRKETK